jgi:hypothetical protein
LHKRAYIVLLKEFLAVDQDEGGIFQNHSLALQTDNSETCQSCLQPYILWRTASPSIKHPTLRIIKKIQVVYCWEDIRPTNCMIVYETCKSRRVYMTGRQ